MLFLLIHITCLNHKCLFAQKYSSSSESEDENPEAQPLSTVRPEEIPPIPENRFLMRKSPPKADEKEKERKSREKERER
mgnify:CR=1 FL=1